MRKLYEIFKVLKIQKRIVSPETICGNTVVSPILFTEFVKKRGKLFKEIRYLGTCKATHQSCKCRPSVDWFLALFQRYPFEVPAAASQNYLKIVQIWIDVKKQLTISHIGPFINHPKYFFA